MSDIIKGAKQLLDGATPAPWEWVGYDLEQISSAGGATVLEFQCVTEFGMSGALRDLEVTPEDEELIAAAPELAQALSEETWEYSYQELRGDEWETAFNDVTHLEEWWPKKSDVDWIVEEARKHGYVCRLVRRGVSPVEVISE